jgi:hypothetical protein
VKASGRRHFPPCPIFPTPPGIPVPLRTRGPSHRVDSALRVWVSRRRSLGEGDERLTFCGWDDGRLLTPVVSRTMHSACSKLTRPCVRIAASRPARSILKAEIVSGNSDDPNQGTYLFVRHTRSKTLPRNTHSVGDPRINFSSFLLRTIPNVVT